MDVRVRVACFGFVGVTRPPAIAAREVDGRPEDASGRETEPRLRSSRALTMSCSFAPAKADAAATRNTFARSDIGTAPIRAEPRREETAVDTRCSTEHPADDRPRTPTRGDAPRTRECGRKGARGAVSNRSSL